MCEHYKYMIQIKPEFDDKFKITGKRSQMIYLCEVEDVARGKYQLNYDKKRFNLIVKECGKCHICRFKRASIKAAQAQCEYKSVGKGAFLTLTFSPEKTKELIYNDKRYKNMSSSMKRKYYNYLQWSLEKREFQLFIKRLRWKVYQDDLLKFSVDHKYFDNYLTLSGKVRSKVLKLDKYDYSEFKPRKIRYMHCGEYGELKSRPHHHCIIYGIDFSHDYSKARWSWKKQRNVVVHFNNMLNDLWPFGDITTDKVNYQTCNYVARYITKKTVNKDKFMDKVDLSGSVYRGRMPEYCTQSNRRGLGYDYYMQNAKKINADLSLSFTNMNGEVKTCPLPRYFKELMRKHFKRDWLRMNNISIEQQKQFSKTDSDLLLNRMFKDRNKIVNMRMKFKGAFEKEVMSVNQARYIEFNFKNEIFNNLSHRDIYYSSYTDFDYVSKKEKWRITCYNNFEKYRKFLKRKAFNSYVDSKLKSPDLKNNVLLLHVRRNSIDSIVNPFCRDELDKLCTGKGIKLVDKLYERWYEYEPNYS